MMVLTLGALPRATTCGPYGSVRIRIRDRMTSMQEMEPEVHPSVVGKDARHAVFASFIASKLLCGSGGSVLDVAGGKGHLSQALGIGRMHPYYIENTKEERLKRIADEILILGNHEIFGF